MPAHTSEPRPTASDRTGLTRRTLLRGAGAVGLGAAAATSPSSAAAAAPAARRPLQVGYVCAHEQFRTPYLVDNAVPAERAGFDTVWTSDHFQPWQDNQGHAMFPWLTLALIGDRTRRVHFGTGVTSPIHRHHPSDVAQAFASLGILSPGRVFLGVGTGEALNEQAATGHFGRYPERAARLVEAVQLIRRLWTGERVTFHGRYFSTDAAKLYDVPERPVPIYIAASGLKSAYLAGRHGDGWITGAADLAKPELRAAFRRGAEAAGKDPATLPILAESFVVVGGQEQTEYAARRWHFTVNPWGKLLYVPDPVRIQQLAQKWWPLKTVYAKWARGTDPTTHVQAMRDLHALGATTVFIHSGQADQQRVIDFYGRSVLPKL